MENGFDVSRVLHLVETVDLASVGQRCSPRVWSLTVGFILAHIEWIALAMNTLIFLAFLLKGDEIGKTVYWAGTILIVIGLLKMKG